MRIVTLAIYLRSIKGVRRYPRYPRSTILRIFSTAVKETADFADVRESSRRLVRRTLDTGHFEINDFWIDGLGVEHASVPRCLRGESDFGRGRMPRYITRMHSDIERILIPREKIAQRVQELGKQIAADIGNTSDLTIVPILTGAMIFCGDLIREIPNRMKIGLMTVSSYPGRSVASQGAQVIQRQLKNVEGRHVLVVDDILDSGNTMGMVLPALREMGAWSVRSCVLLRKDRPAAKSIAVDYVGFEIPDEFVVGYGLDYNDYYRNLPDIVTLKKSVLDA